MDLDAYFAEHPENAGCQMDAPPDFRSGFMALVGRPNAGKSTLLNALVGSKVAITSKTPQTTRTQVRGVLTRPEFQVVLIDTPGMHKPHDALGIQLNNAAYAALEDVDVVGMLIDATKAVGAGDERVAGHVAQASGAKILILTKADIATKDQIAQRFEEARDLVEWDAIVSLSARSGYNTGALIEEVVQLLPTGPLWFPPDASSDMDTSLLIAEIVREKVLRRFREEVPHSVGVLVNEMEQTPKLLRAEATIYVERESQKGMLIGAHGQSVKEIGKLARHDLEQMFGVKVYLALNVKVKKNWRRDDNEIKRLGYMD